MFLKKKRILTKERMIGIANERKREKGRNEWEVSGQIFRKTEIEESVVTLCLCLSTN